MVGRALQGEWRVGSGEWGRQNGLASGEWGLSRLKDEEF